MGFRARPDYLKDKDYLSAGSALPVVLFSTLIISLLGAGLLSLVLSERQVAANEVAVTQARYLAEAGFNLALAHLQADPFWRDAGSLSGQPLLPPAAGYIKSVALEEHGIFIRIRAKGENSGVERMVQGDVLLPLGSFALAAGYSGGTLDVKNKPEVNGSVLYWGDILVRDKNFDGWVVATGNLTNSKTITGGAVAGKSIVNNGTINGPAYYGETYQGAPSNPPPVKEPLNVPGLPVQPAGEYSGDVYLPAGAYTVDFLQAVVDGLPGKTGVIYVSGDLIINPENKEKGGGDTFTYEGQVVLAVDGDITLNVGLAAGPGSVWALVANQNIVLGKKIDADGVLVSGGVFINEGNNSTINGCLIAGALDASKEHFTVNYRSDLVAGIQPLLRGRPGRCQVLSWHYATP